MAPKRAKKKGKQVASAQPPADLSAAFTINAQQASVAPKGDSAPASMPPPPVKLENYVPLYEPKVDVDELVKQLEKASTTEQQVELFSSLGTQAVLRMLEGGGKICDYIEPLRSDIVAAAIRKVIEKLEGQIANFNYSELSFMRALKHWIWVKGVWLSRPIQRDHMRTFAKWYVHCKGVTQPEVRREDVAKLTEYAIDLVEVHLTHHRPFSAWLVGPEFNALKPINSPFGLFNLEKMNIKWPEYARIKHRGRMWNYRGDQDTDYDDYQRVQGCYARGLEPWFDIRAYYARDFYVLFTPGEVFRVADDEGSNRINHLFKLYRNNLVREGFLDDETEATWDGIEMPDLPTLPNYPWSDEELPIFAYCAHEDVTAWARIAFAPPGLEALRAAWVAENLYVW